jgi:hypothetical protein
VSRHEGRTAVITGANEAKTAETLAGMRPRTLAGGNTREVP